MFESETFYRPVSIGSVKIPGNLFLAPIAGYSDRAFRAICYKYGCNFGFTEMVSAEALVRGSQKTEILAKRAENEILYAVQLFGGTPDVMSRAVRIILDTEKPDIIDINAGCPVPKIVKTGAGAQLTRDPDQLFKIVRAAVSVSDVPVTVKIRSGWDNSHFTWREAALAAVDAGAKAVTLHPRTRAQGYEGDSDWALLSQLVDEVSGKIPVFGSGDLFSPEAALEMLNETGCDAVLFARGAMGNPFIFKQTRDLLISGTYSEINVREKLQTGIYELELLIADYGEPSACREMRKRFCSYTKGLPGSSELRKQIVDCETLNDYQEVFKYINKLQLDI